MVTRQVDSIKTELIELNEKFHKKLLINESFYNQLMQNGFVLHKCLLLSIFPDSSNTFCGKIIRQDGCVFEFDIDLYSAEYSSWEDVTKSFRELCEKSKMKKPLLKELVAYNLFCEWKQ